MLIINKQEFTLKNIIECLNPGELKSLLTRFSQNLGLVELHVNNNAVFTMGLDDLFQLEENTIITIQELDEFKENFYTLIDLEQNYETCAIGIADARIMCVLPPVQESPSLVIRKPYQRKLSIRDLKERAIRLL